MTYEPAPLREETETRHCPDCKVKTTHDVVKWPTHTTADCRLCGTIWQVAQ